MRILLFGCNGLLGQNVTRLVPADFELIGSGVELEPVSSSKIEYHQADLGSPDAIKQLIDQTSPEFIINCAAITNVDLCEKEKALCARINRDAVGDMASMGVPLVQISTDYVFDGSAGPYSEEDKTGPLGYYGTTKLESEDLVWKYSRDSLVLRTMLLWGTGSGIKTSFVEFVRESLRTRKPIRIVTDQLGSPTLADELADVIWALLSKRKSGLFHVSGSECKSRFDWAVDIARFYGLREDLIEPVPTTDLEQAAPRPLKSGFILQKLEREIGYSMSDIMAQLQKIP